MSDQDKSGETSETKPNQAKRQLFQAIQNWATDDNRMPVAHLAAAALLELDDPERAAQGGALYAADRILGALSVLSGDRPDGARPKGGFAY